MKYINYKPNAAVEMKQPPPPPPPPPTAGGGATVESLSVMVSIAVIIDPKVAPP